jgi:predicted NBD/HSP70 family sugar kinase
LTLTDAGTANLAAELGPSVAAVGGRLVNDSGDAYVLALSESRKRNGMEIDWRGEQVAINKSLVASIQQRQFSRTRTAFVGAGLIGGVLLARQILWGPGGVFGGSSPGPGPGPR